MKKIPSFSLLATSMLLGVSILANTSAVAKAEANNETSVNQCLTWTTDEGGNEFIMLYLTNSDYPTEWSGGPSTYNQWLQDRSLTFNHLENILIDGETIASVMTANGVAPYAWESCINMWQRPGTFAFRAYQHNYETITIKSGCKFPSYSYAMGGEQSYYVVNEDVTFKRNTSDHNVGGSDSWSLYVPPYTYEGTRISTAAVASQFRSSDSTTYWFKLELANSDYSGAVNGASLSKDTYFTNLNTLDKVYLRCFDGTTYKLRDFAGNDFQLKHWGEPALWFAVNPEIFSSTAKTQKYISAIIVEEGCEFPSFAGVNKYVINSETSLAWANGSASYTDEVGTGYSFDGDRTTFGEKSLGHIAYRSCLGTVSAKPVKDIGGDTFSSLWIKVDGADYQGQPANQYLPMLTYFGLNTLEKIKVDGTPLSLKYRYGDPAACINKFERWENIAITPNGTFDYRNIQTVTIEKGCEFPAYDNRNDGFYNNGTIKYYVTEETVTYEFVSELGDFYNPIHVYFDDVETKVYEGVTIPSSCLPVDPTKEGTELVDYLFDGWYIKGTDTKFDVTNDIPEDGMELVSHYRETAKQYTITYLHDNGSVYKTVKVPNGEAFNLIDVPTKKGYTGRWHGTTYDVMPAQDITYIATYSANTYTLSFEGVNTTIEVTYDSPIGESLPTPPSKAGYNIDTWVVDDLVITSETVWKFDSDKIATATGTANKYRLTFDNVIREVTFDSPIGELPMGPAKTGYTFDGWYIRENKLTPEYVWNFINDEVAEPHYVANEYHLTFKDLNVVIVATYDQPIGNLPEVPTRAGYKSSSWMIDGEVITSETVWKFTENKQATYTESIATYTLSFEGIEDTLTVTYGEAIGELPMVPTRTGYTGKWMLGNEELTASTIYNYGEDKMATIQWTAIKYHVYFEGDGVDTPTQVVAFGATAIEPGEPELEGYTFAGWFVKQADGSLGEQFSFSTVITGDITLVAKWNKISKKSGCGGSIITASAIIALTSLAGVILVSKKKKEDK